MPQLFADKNDQLYLQPSTSRGDYATTVRIDIVDSTGKFVQKFSEVYNGIIFMHQMPKEVMARLGMASYSSDGGYLEVRNGNSVLRSTPQSVEEAPAPTDADAPPAAPCFNERIAA